MPGPAPGMRDGEPASRRSIAAGRVRSLGSFARRGDSIHARGSRRRPRSGASSSTRNVARPGAISRRIRPAARIASEARPASSAARSSKSIAVDEDEVGLAAERLDDALDARRRGGPASPRRAAGARSRSGARTRRGPRGRRRAGGTGRAASSWGRSPPSGCRTRSLDRSRRRGSRAARAVTSWPQSGTTNSRASGSWRCERPGVADRDERVAIAADDQRRHVDRVELGRRQQRLVGDIGGDRGQQRLPRARALDRVVERVRGRAPSAGRRGRSARGPAGAGDRARGSRCG